LLIDEPFSAPDDLRRGAAGRHRCDPQSHQVDRVHDHTRHEARLRADKVLLLTNRPKAWIAELIENALPAERARIELHEHANTYPLRNHLMDFAGHTFAGACKAFPNARQGFAPRRCASRRHHLQAANAVAAVAPHRPGQPASDNSRPATFARFNLAFPDSAKAELPARRKAASPRRHGFVSAITARE
jgi:nitrate/nitrite transport system ATP-binding protein